VDEGFGWAPPAVEPVSAFTRDQASVEPVDASTRDEAAVEPVDAFTRDQTAAEPVSAFTEPPPAVEPVATPRSPFRDDTPDLSDAAAPTDEAEASPVVGSAGLTPDGQGDADVSSAAEPDLEEADEPTTRELLALLGLGEEPDEFDDEPELDAETEMLTPVPATRVLPPIAAPVTRESDDHTEALPPIAVTDTSRADSPEAREGDDDRTALLLPVAVAAAPGDDGAVPAGSFMPAERKGMLAWSSRVRWSVAASVVLLAVVIAGAVIFAQNFAATNREAQALAAAVAELEGAEANATQPYGLMESAFAEYDAAALAARAAADSAGPALASVVGMTDEAPLTAANAALAALVAQLDDTTLAAAPERYERGEVDMSDPEQIAAAAQTADNRAQAIATATREARAAQAALVEKTAALTAAQVALGSSLPATAVVIVGQNPRAEQSFRDAVIAASVAVPAAQAAGGSGDAELLAYSGAVTALRADQASAEDQRSTTPVTPPTTETNPQPEPVPEPPAPAPEPEPTPTEEPPAPEPTATPTP
ncbi:MAG: hypothetical protein ABWZ16_13170, partial [Microbacterium sp.]